MAKRNDATPMLGDDESQEPGARSQESAPTTPAETTHHSPHTTHQPEGLPYCARHNCAMKAGSTQGDVAYYYCDACKKAGYERPPVKRVRHTARIPSEPQACPSALCAKRTESDRSYLEVNQAKSQLAKLWMECPNCGFSVQQPRPAFTGRVPRTEDDLSAR
jgi:hypothetical protein